jgi:hypothetical protein
MEKDMAGIKKVAGAKIFIGPRVDYKTSVAAADFSGKTWKEIGGWTQTGDLGAEQEMLSRRLINQNTTIYAKGGISFPIMTNSFTPMPDDPGQIAFKLAQKSCKPYAFRIDWDGDCGEESEVTFTKDNTDPGEVNWTAHGLENGQAVSFTTTGALPAPLVAGTIYFVVNKATDKFEVATEAGGTGIVFTTDGTGTATAMAPQAGSSDLFFGFAMYGTSTGGDASAMRGLNLPIQPIAPAITI